MAQSKPNQVLAIACVGVVLATLDLFIVSVALPSIGRDFGEVSLDDLSWTLNGYTIVYAALLVFMGRLTERHRRDRSYLVGMAMFTAASAGCAAAAGVWMLVAFRILQAAGAALMTPTSLGLVLAAFQPAERSGAARIWTAVGGFAGALGPVAGGLLLTLSWNWIFIVNVPIGLIALLIGWKVLPAVHGHDVPRPDVWGAALVTAGVALLTYGLISAGDLGWSHPRAFLSLATGRQFPDAVGFEHARGRDIAVQRLFARTELLGELFDKPLLLPARQRLVAIGVGTNDLSDAALDEPSRIPGVSRRVIVAHVGYHTRLLSELVAWARSGAGGHFPAEAAVNEEDVRRRATQPARALRNLVAHSAVHLNVEWRDLSDAQWDASVRDRAGRTIDIRSKPWRRAVAVWLHAVDLSNGGRFADLPRDLVKKLIHGFAAQDAPDDGHPFTFIERGEIVEIRDNARVTVNCRAADIAR
jgi:uncharacterized protein (TIGR03083 family)